MTCWLLWLTPTIVCALLNVQAARFALISQMQSLIMQGHALFTRQAGGDLPCPALDFTGGFNQFMAAAYNLTGQTVGEKFGAAFGEIPVPAVPLLSPI